MRPLELTVYPKRLVDSGYHRIDADGSWITIRTEQWLIGGDWVFPPSWPDKRFTDAELAAEMHKAEAEFRAAAGYGYSAEIVRECDRKQYILGRFATLPHYDEPQP